MIFSADAIEKNQQLEFERNFEKLQILKVNFYGSKKIYLDKRMIFIYSGVQMLLIVYQ